MFVQDLSQIACQLSIEYNTIYIFEPPFGGLRGNVCDSSLARWKARGRLPIYSSELNIFARDDDVRVVGVLAH